MSLLLLLKWTLPFIGEKTFSPCSLETMRQLQVKDKSMLSLSAVEWAESSSGYKPAELPTKEREGVSYFQRFLYGVSALG